MSDGARVAGQLTQEVLEVDGSNGSRMLARRKVRKAACSMRKFKSTGRIDQEGETEIAYYIETDDEGLLQF